MPPDINQERDESMAQRYATEDITMTELAVENGLTRERVRQILGGQGLKRANGFKALSRGARKEAKIAANRDRHCQYRYGCDFATVKRITGRERMFGLRSHPLLKKYDDHKGNANRHGIPWQLTLPQYASIIGDNLLRMNLSKAGLVLSRKDKSGPFSQENCELSTLSANSFASGGYEKAKQKQIVDSRAAIEQTVALRKSGLSNANIGAVLKCCIATVQARISRAKRLGLI